MANEQTAFTFPVGRLVGGNIYKPFKRTDNAGKVKLNADGTEQMSYTVIVAIPKKPGENAWWDAVDRDPTTGQPTEKIGAWGLKLFQLAASFWPQGQYQRPDFAFKVSDGDSQVLNKKMKRNCDKEGYPGHWIVATSNGFAPRTVNANGTQDIPAAGEPIKPGHYVQLRCGISSNNSDQTAGIYINVNIVAHSGFGPEIALGNGEDASSVGFGAGALPAGATAVPQGALGMPPIPSVAGGVAMPALPQANPIPPTPQGVAHSIALPTPIAPNPAFVTSALPPGVVAAPVASVPAMPVAPAIPLPPAAVVAQPQRYMVGPMATGTRYEDWVANNWTDAALIAAGHMVIQ